MYFTSYVELAVAVLMLDGVAKLEDEDTGRLSSMLHLISKIKSVPQINIIYPMSCSCWRPWYTCAAA